MPKIGLRIVKSAIAVSLCFGVYMLRGVGTPFYSAIAAVLCMQPELGDSWSKGKSRCMGTLFGGIAGMFALILFQNYFPSDMDWLRYACISLFIIPLLYSTILLKQSSSSYLSCVVFMSITISHIGDVSPYGFALSRMLDTFIGIFVALAVNAFHIPRKKYKDVLIELPLAHILQDEKLTTRSLVHLNACIDRGAQILFTTRHAPSVTASILHGIHAPVRCLCMDGVLLYDVSKETCRALFSMNATLYNPILDVLKTQGVTPFVYEIRDELLYVHYQSFINDEMSEYYRMHYKRNHQRYIYHEEEFTMHSDIVCMMVLITDDQYDIIIRELKGFSKLITCISYPYKQGYRMFKICPLELANVDVSEEIAHTMKLRSVIKIRKKSEKERIESQVKKVEYAFYHGRAKD